jgi:hypothetical protein
MFLPSSIAACLIAPIALLISANAPSSLALTVTSPGPVLQHPARRAQIRKSVQVIGMLSRHFRVREGRKQYQGGGEGPHIIKSHRGFLG